MTNGRKARRTTIPRHGLDWRDPRSASKFLRLSVSGYLILFWPRTITRVQLGVFLLMNSSLFVEVVLKLLGHPLPDTTSIFGECCLAFESLAACLQIFFEPGTEYHECVPRPRWLYCLG